MDNGKLLLAAMAFAIISFAVHSAGALLDMPYYANPANFGLWSAIMMPAAGPPGMEFFAVSILFSLITGLIFADAYALTKGVFAAKKSFKAGKYFHVGLKFGLFLFLLSSFAPFLATFLMLAVPFGLLLSWMAQGLAISLASGVAFAKIMGC